MRCVEARGSAREQNSDSFASRARRLQVASVCVLWLLFSTAFASAQGAHEDGARGRAASSEQKAPASYYRAIDRAFEEFKLGNYAEARARFHEAHDLFPSAQTYRALGMVEYELKNYLDAIAALQLALASKVKPLTATVRKQTEELLEEARGYVARIHLQVSPNTAVTTVDGVPARVGADGTLLLQVGDHSIELVAPAHLAHKRQIKIVGGEEQTLRVVLQPVAGETAPRASGAPAPATKDDAPAPPRRPLRRNPWLWTAVGAVAVAAGLGLGFGLRTGERRADDTHVSGTTGISLAGPQ
jgi:hypothetical protein